MIVDKQGVILGIDGRSGEIHAEPPYWRDDNLRLSAFDRRAFRVERGNNTGRCWTRLLQLQVFIIVVEESQIGSRSEEHTSELQSLMRISYAVFCLKNKHNTTKHY